MGPAGVSNEDDEGGASSPQQDAVDASASDEAIEKSMTSSSAQPGHAPSVLKSRKDGTEDLAQCRTPILSVPLADGSTQGESTDVSGVRPGVCEKSSTNLHEANSMAGNDGGTYQYQSSLPKLAIPPLEDTLRRYLNTVEPLLSRDAFEKTKEVVREFKTSGEGDTLQQALIEYSKNKDSYVEEFWNDSYLTPKSSVVLNLNPFFVFETPSLSGHIQDWGDGVSGGVSTPQGMQQVPKNMSGPACTACECGATPGDGVSNSRGTFIAGKRQARRAASLLFSSLRFASAVRSENLPPDVWRNTPLCMSQYRRLFGAHRKAVANEPDRMNICEDSGHVIVVCRNQFYFFSAMHSDGRVGVTEEELEEIINAVQDDATKLDRRQAAAEAVGVLTTETRDDWAMARVMLTKSSQDNARLLHVVDTALFVLCLDHTSPSSAAEIAASCLHGSSTLDGDTQIGTCANRWYDKLQIIVFENGAAGVNFEHTWVDGHTVLRFASDVFADVIYRFANHLTSSTGSGRGGIGAVFPADDRPFVPCSGRAPLKIEWELSEDIRRAIYFAETRLSDLIHQHDVQALEYGRFGKRFITSNKMSPDAFVQMGLVYGYYSLYGNVVSAYEPVLTKMFLKGRTEALRVVTAEVKAFLQAWCDPTTTMKERMASLRTATASHSRLVKLAAKGQGVDRHLFALKSIASKQYCSGGKDDTTSIEPALFEDEAWRTLNNIILSTSNCGNQSLRLFGFGPVVREGFGVGYIIKDGQLKLVVTSKNRQTSRLVGKIKEFYDAVFEACSPAKGHGRIRVSSASRPDEFNNATYSMWGSFTSTAGHRQSMPL